MFVFTDEYSSSRMQPGQILPLRNLHLSALDSALQKKAKAELEVLDARDNKLSTLPDSLGQYNMLQTLNLDNNQIVEFPLKSLRKVKALKRLNLSNQHDPNRKTLSTIPVLICKLGTLQELYLCYNKISEFSQSICCLRSLRILDFEGNHLKSVPPNLANLEKLEYLGLHNNELTTLQENIGKLTALKVLRLSKNNLQVLPDSLCELTNLQTLSLKNNKLERLPECFFKLRKLLEKDVFETMGTRFRNGCSLEKNPMKFPPSNIVQEGLEHVMEYLEVIHTQPDIAPGYEAPGTSDVSREQDTPPEEFLQGPEQPTATDEIPTSMCFLIVVVDDSIA